MLECRDSRSILNSAFLMQNDATTSSSLRKPGLYFLMLTAIAPLRLSRYRRPVEVDGLTYRIRHQSSRSPDTKP